MSTKGLFATRSGAILAILGTMAIAMAAYAASTGALWVVSLGFMNAAAVLTPLGWLGLVLCWVGFAVSRHALLQGGGILILILVAGAGIVGVLLRRVQSDEGCPCARDHQVG
jgi:hypothetical protein